MTELPQGSGLVRPMLGRYFQVGLRNAQAQPPKSDVQPHKPTADQVSLSPGLRKLEAGSAVLQKTVAQLRQRNVPFGAEKPLVPLMADPTEGTELQAAILPASNHAGGSLAEEVVSKIVGPAFDKFQADHPTPTAEELDAFRGQVVDSVTTGFAEARRHLEQMGGFDGEVAEHLDAAQSKALERLDGFMRNVGQFAGK